MHFLDLRTIVFADSINFIACTLFVVALWRHNRGRFAGLGFMVAAFTLQTLAMFLIALRGVIPDFASIAIANTSFFAASVLALMGLERFVGKVRSQVCNFLLLAVYSVLFTYFAMAPVSLAPRNFTVTVGLLVIWSQLAWLMLRRADSDMRHATFSVGMVYVGFCLTNVVRIARYLTTPVTTDDYMQSGTFEIVILQTYGVLTISLTIALMLMVSRRLTIDLKGQEQMFATAFRSSPYGLTLTRLEDGTIFEVNDGFLDISGFSRDEVVGRTTLDLQIWTDNETRRNVVDELLRSGRVRDREHRLRKKSGEQMTVVFSADVITIGDRRCILSGISDISERKRMEDEIRDLSLRDSLTGLFNRRGFFVMIGQKITEASRTRTQLQIIFLDADGFKKINDSLGHEEGDRALRDVTSILLATFRESDIVARVGGDEFTVCLSESTGMQAEKALERFQENVAAFNEQESRPYLLAISFGTATYDPDAPRSVDELLSEADRQMYRHKQQKVGLPGT